MVKKQDSGSSASGKPGIESIPDKVDPRFWIREDGALCWGDGCLVIKPEGKDLRISVDDSKCGELALEAYGKVIEETVGKGGKTIYEVTPKIEVKEKK